MNSLITSSSRTVRLGLSPSRLQTCFRVSPKVTELCMTKLPARLHTKLYPPTSYTMEKPDPGKAAGLWLVSRLSPKPKLLAESGGVINRDSKCLIETHKGQ